MPFSILGSSHLGKDTPAHQQLPSAAHQPEGVTWTKVCQRVCSTGVRVSGYATTPARSWAVNQEEREDAH